MTVLRAEKVTTISASNSMMRMKLPTSPAEGDADEACAKESNLSWDIE